MGKLWVFFLSCTAPGFQLWFYFHLWLWVVHWGFAREAALEDLALPLGGPGAEVVQLLSLQGFWQHQVLGIGGKCNRKYSALEGYGNQYWPACIGHEQYMKRPRVHRHKIFFCLWLKRVECVGGTAAWVAGTLVASSVQGYRLLQLLGLWPYQSLFFKPLVAGDQKVSLASLSL